MNKAKDFGNDDLKAQAQETYDKGRWTPEDIRFLRECWNEMEKRGGFNAVMFFAPAYFSVLKFHEIDSGEVNESEVQMYERTGAEIASDYREVMRKLDTATVG